MKIIDRKNWSRREHFEFFSSYDDPFFGITAEVDCTLAYDLCKANDFSFFAYYLYKSSEAVNRIEELKYRIINEEIVLFDLIHVASTIGRQDGTFGFSFVEHSKAFQDFESLLKDEIRSVEQSEGLRAGIDAYRNDVIHYSTIPWTKFSALSHPKKFRSQDSVPKITFGKSSISQSRRILPVSIHAHHGLVDGFHLSKYLEQFQSLLNE